MIDNLLETQLVDEQTSPIALDHYWISSSHYSSIGENEYFKTYELRELQI